MSTNKTLGILPHSLNLLVELLDSSNLEDTDYMLKHAKAMASDLTISASTRTTWKNVAKLLAKEKARF